MSQTCENCEGKGWYGDNGPGVTNNREFQRCECGAVNKCGIGAHKYAIHLLDNPEFWETQANDGVAWCDTCDLEADMEVCRMHPLPKAPIVCKSVVGNGNAQPTTCKNCILIGRNAGRDLTENDDGLTIIGDDVYDMSPGPNTVLIVQGRLAIGRTVFGHPTAVYLAMKENEMKDCLIQGAMRARNLTIEEQKS